MQYDEIVQALQNLAEVPLNNTDNNFAIVLPQSFDYAENRIYREIDLLATTISSSGTTLVTGDGRLAVPTGFISLQYVNLCSPDISSADDGTRYPMERVSPEFLDMTWPTATMTSGSPSIPTKYCMYGDPSNNAFSSAGAFTIRVAPAPSTGYVAEFIGPVRPPVLSKDSPSNVLTVRYPDLYIAACMVFLMGYQRDFGAQSDDPAKAMSWEKIYTSLREGIMVEVQRQKSESVGWSTHTPSVLANQPRDRMPGGAPSGGGR